MDLHRIIGGATAALLLGAMALPAAAATITIPDPGSTPDYAFYGTGDATVTFDGVTFTQSASLGDKALLYDIGSGYSKERTVLSSQAASEGVENILISFASPLTNLSFDFGTFNGSTVNFALSNGDSFSRSTTGGSLYAVPDLFAVNEATPFTSVLVTSSDYVLDIAGVPEPAAWAIMLLGVAAVGAGLRTSLRDDRAASTEA